MAKNVEVYDMDKIAQESLALCHQVMEQYLNLMGNIPNKYILTDRLREYVSFQEKKQNLDAKFIHLKMKK